MHSSSPCHNHRVIHSGIMFVIHRCVAPPCKCSATQITEYCAKSTKKKKKTENTQQRKVHTTRELCQSIPFIPKSYDDVVYMAHMNKLLYESETAGVQQKKTEPHRNIIFTAATPPSKHQTKIIIKYS